MKIPAKHYKFYVASIEKLTHRGHFDWCDVIREVNGTDYEPKNWMVVRAVLQEAINAGKIVRDKNLMGEHYIAV